MLRPRSSGPGIRRALSPTLILASLAIVLVALTAAAPLAAQAAPVLAQAFDAAGGDGTLEESSDDETMFSLVLKGGWLMVPIGLASLVVLTVAFERGISLRRGRTTPSGLLDEVFRRVPHRRTSRVDRESCAAMLGQDDSLLANVLRAGVLQVARGAKSVEAHLSESISKQLHLLKRRLRPLSIVGSIAPLLGLLGTIYGMISCFSEAGAAESSSRTQVLAEGIYAALVTTAAGLTVAIPALVLYHYFLGRVDRVIDQLEEASTDLLEHYYGEDESEDDVASAKREKPPAVATTGAGAHGVRGTN